MNEYELDALFLSLVYVTIILSNIPAVFGDVTSPASGDVWYAGYPYSISWDPRVFEGESAQAYHWIECVIWCALSTFQASRTARVPNITRVAMTLSYTRKPR